MSMILNPYRYAAGGGGLALDLVPGATMAYGLFELNSSYSGDCIRVREDGGNTETDIGFANGEVDTSAIASHCGANNGFIVTWYDQSGNGYDWTAENDAHEWQIYDGSTVLTDPGTGETVASPTIDDSYNYTVNAGSPPGAGTADWTVVFRHKETGTPNRAGLFNSADLNDRYGSNSGSSLTVKIGGTNYDPTPPASLASYDWYAMTADRSADVTTWAGGSSVGSVSIAAESATVMQPPVSFLGRGARNWGGTFRCGVYYHNTLLDSDDIETWHGF